MALASSSSHCSCSFASQLLPLPKPKTPLFFFPTPPSPSSSPILLPSPLSLRPRKPICAASKTNPSVSSKSQDKTNKTNEAKEEEEFEEVEEDLPWIQEKALDVVEFTGSVTQAIPGPRVGTSSLPWILALPLGYAGLTFVIAFVKTVRKFTSPRAKRKRLVRISSYLSLSLEVLLYWVSFVFWVEKIG